MCICVCVSHKFYSYVDWALACLLEGSPMSRETLIQSQVESFQRIKKIALDTSLLNTKLYKVTIKGKKE